MDNDLTTIQISKRNRERLGALGNRNDKSLDTVLSKVLDMYEEYRMNQIIEEKSS